MKDKLGNPLAIGDEIIALRDGKYLTVGFLSDECGETTIAST